MALHCAVGQARASAMAGWRAVVVALAAAAALLGVAAGQQPRERREFRGSYGSGLSEHERYGREVGAAFAADIRATLAESVKEGTLSIIKPFVQTPEGKSNYSVMLRTHNETFPEYVAEITGMAAGAGVDFDDLLSLNLGESLSTIAEPYDVTRALGAMRERCSEYTLWPWDAHNEDSGRSDMNTSFWAKVTIDGASFEGFVYSGMLASGAFAWNSHAIAFTLNWLGPHAVDVRGIGRNFLSRDLLRATTMQDAVRRVTDAHPSATGHNYQLMSFNERRIVNVEAAPHGLFRVTPFDEGTPASFHANSYIHMTLPQYVSASSRHRLARAAALPTPTTPAEMLAVLGDQADTAEPIFHDDASWGRGDQSGDMTMTTVLFDLANHTVTQYYGDPKRLDVLRTWVL